MRGGGGVDRDAERFPRVALAHRVLGEDPVLTADVEHRLIHRALTRGGAQRFPPERARRPAHLAPAHSRVDRVLLAGEEQAGRAERRPPTPGPLPEQATGYRVV